MATILIIGRDPALTAVLMSIATNVVREGHGVHPHIMDNMPTSDDVKASIGWNLRGSDYALIGLNVGMPHDLELYAAQRCTELRKPFSFYVAANPVVDTPGAGGNNPDMVLVAHDDIVAWAETTYPGAIVRSLNAAQAATLLIDRASPRH